jgi:hypothetical protein
MTETEMVRPEVPTAVFLSIQVIWDMTLYG